MAQQSESCRKAVWTILHAADDYEARALIGRWPRAACCHWREMSLRRNVNDATPGADGEVERCTPDHPRRSGHWRDLIFGRASGAIALAAPQDVKISSHPPSISILEWLHALLAGTRHRAGWLGFSLRDGTYSRNAYDVHISDDNAIDGAVAGVGAPVCSATASGADAGDNVIENCPPSPSGPAASSVADRRSYNPTVQP